MEAIELLEGVEILSMGKPMPLALGIFLVVLCLFVIGLSAYLLVDAAKYGSAGGVFSQLTFYWYWNFVIYSYTPGNN